MGTWAEVTPHPGDGIGVDALVLPGRGFLLVLSYWNVIFWFKSCLL